MDREKIKYIPFGACEYEYMEAWLEDLAREGWLLQSMFACFATFRESEPKQLRYRIVPNAAFQADEEEISFYEENGWHFVGCSRGLNVFCCEDPRVPELFTDLQSFSRRVRNYAIASGICVLSFGYLIWRNSMNGYGIFRQYGGFLHAIHELGIITFPAISFLILLAIAVSVRCAVKYARHAKRIACRQKIERKHNFRRVAAINVAWISAAMLCTTALGVGLISNSFSSENTCIAAQREQHPAGVKQVDAEFSNAIDGALEMAAEGCQPDSYDYFVTSKHTILFNEYREIQAQYTDSDYDLETGTLQQHNDTEGTPVLSEDRLYHAVYAKTRSEKTAARFLTEQKHMTITNDLFDKTGSKEKSLTAEGFDTAEYLCTYDLADQYLFLRRGNIIEYIHYEGPEDLESHAAAIMRDLNN